MLQGKIEIFDGGFGSELDRLGLPTTNPEDLNIDNPEAIRNIHLSYAKYADYITTNTFGLNSIKYHGKYNIKDVAIEAISNARVTNKKVFFDIGPTGAMLKPLGTLSFDDAYNAFKEIALITRDLVDGYIVETFSDLYEIKACILALKENTNLPIYATMTFDKTERTLTGSSPEIVANTLTNLGVSALGVNCSLGPKELFSIVKRMTEYTNLPIIIQPNRGLPKIKNGKTYYDMSEEEFVSEVEKYIPLGVSILGGCCGTTPEFIEGLAKKFKGLEVKEREYQPKTLINSASKMVEIDGVKVCGERLNPTGKKKLKAALKDEDYDYLVSLALAQEENSDLLDLNCGLPGIDEPKVMRNAVTKIQEFVDLPLQIDSSNVEAIEAGCRYYNGIPLVNSVNATKEIMDKVFPIVKKYGAVILGLAMDDNGVPKTAEERFEKAKLILNTALSYGIPKERVMIDTLVLTASAEQDLVKETLKALTLVRGLGVKTALGVSNVSFGLPFRPLLNRTFLTMAMYAGLNMPIINPSDLEMIHAIYAYRALVSIDKNSEAFIERFAEMEEVKSTVVAKGTVEKQDSNTLDLYQAVKKGLKNMVPNLLNKELEEKEPMVIINDVLIKALNDVGDAYDKGKMYLPQLIASAEAAKEAFSIISLKFPSSGEVKGTVVMCTVKGDVHDIGKNICKVVMESYGYKVIDLGKDTPIEVVVDAYQKYNPDVIGLSALMTTTVVSMEETIKALRKINCKAKIVVGGAVLTEDIAKRIGADYYSKDALDLVNTLDRIIKK